MIESRPLQIRSAEPSDGLVAAVESLLEDVKSGAIRELAWAARMQGDEIQTSSVGENEDLFRMVGALRYLEHRLLAGVE